MGFQWFVTGLSSETGRKGKEERRNKGIGKGAGEGDIGERGKEREGMALSSWYNLCHDINLIPNLAENK